MSRPYRLATNNLESDLWWLAQEIPLVHFWLRRSLDIVRLVVAHWENWLSPLRCLVEIVSWPAALAFSWEIAGWGISLQSDWGALGNVPIIVIISIFFSYAWRHFTARPTYDKSISPERRGRALEQYVNQYLASTQL